MLLNKGNLGVIFWILGLLGKHLALHKKGGEECVACEIHAETIHFKKKKRIGWRNLCLYVK